MALSKQDLDDLRRAKALLENPGFAAKLSSIVGSPVEKGMKMLPSRVQQTVHLVTEKALNAALKAAVSSLGPGRLTASREGAHKLAAAVTGAAGGFFGAAALSVELPLSTILILRSIAEIASTEGEDPRHIETKLNCLTVFALGSPRSKSDNAAESGYFAARYAMASAVTEAARYLAEKGAAKGTAPALVRLISLIASRFGVVVSQKTAAQMVPVLGAAGGALVNTLFIGHYQDMARGHFIVRRLEKIHGAEPVREAYDKL